MNRLFNSFYVKLAVVFLVLLVALGVVLVFITIDASQEYMRGAEQRMNRRLAHDIAIEFAPLVRDSLEMPGIEHLMHYLMVMNPSIEIYLLDDKGRIQAFFADKGKQVKQDSVSFASIQSFLTNTDANIPILGDDPRNPGLQKPFSVAPINLADNQSGYIYVILGGQQFDAAIGALRNDFVFQTTLRGILLSLAVAAILGLALLFLLTRRLRKITEVVQDFGSGNLSRRLRDTTPDEFGLMASSFDQMADTIAGNLDELRRSDRLRRELVANVSHDLRSPLASMQGYLETIQIKQASLTPPELQHYLQICLANVGNLNRLVSELFELSKLDAKQVQPRIELFSIAELLQDVALKFKPHAEEKRVALDVSLHHSLPSVKGDIGLIERVISNLLENAIRYTPESGRVRIEPEARHLAVRVTISDNGPGIATEDLPHIFQRFYRADRSRAHQGEGAGLGLAIASKIIELHGGQITVESQLDRGTSFSFDLSTN